MAQISLVAALGQVPDPRRRQGTRHPLPAILALTSVAMMCGCRSLYAIAQWGRDHGQAMAGKLGFSRGCTPVVSTLHEVFKRLDAEAFEGALRQWASSWCEALDAGGEAMCLDGKTLRGTQGHRLPAVHLLAAYARRLEIVVGQESADGKQDGGELTAASKLLESLVLKGWIITGDALFAQRNLCQVIVAGQGDYLLTVKDNQPRLKREIEDVFRSPCSPL